MKWVLLFTLGGTGVAIVAACVLVLFVRHRINRHHRVDHSVATDAPLTWLVDPRVPARLHRRLAKVGRTAITVGDDHRPTSRRLRRTEPPPPIVEVADDVRDQAVRLDHQLARLALLAPGARQRPLVELDRSVASLERAASGLVALSAEVRAPRTLAADHPGLLDLSAQVDRLAEAHQALIDLDAEAGLVAEAPPAPPLTRRQAPG
ncbi:MAG: hypothetical protein JWM89_2684 [Acidimicrobiales bacterium]|nr:hypothetical protein [Acidimicrobiales bacterium]